MHLHRAARWLHPSALASELHYCTTFESADAQICSSDNSAAACATARPCSESTEPLQGCGASESVCAQDAHPECAPPENDPGCVPTARPSAESSNIYSGSTPASNFEIGSSHFSASRPFDVQANRQEALVGSRLSHSSF